MPTLSPDLLGLSLLLGVGLGIFVTTVIGRTIYIMTHPPRRTYASAVARGKPGDPSEIPPPRGPRTFSSWSFPSRGRSLPVWDVVGDNAAGPIIILSHGWGDSRVGGLSRLPELARHASRLILWDMPGHGDAPGTCSLGTREVDDLLELIRCVREPNRDIVLYGWSMGSGVSIAAAASDVRQRQARIAAVIAEAPSRGIVAPARAVLRENNLPRSWNVMPALWLLGIDFGVGPTWRRKGPFDRAELAGRLECPLLVLRGEHDAIASHEDAAAIATAARGTLATIPGGGHHGLWTNEAHAAEVRRVVHPFLAALTGLPRPAPSPRSRAGSEKL
ncbi:MAG: alpha/beta hydrolase [Phycisphaerales bacterium]|nr:alpha/beta hydrolase [Phycisphaerales bacterium]